MKARKPLFKGLKKYGIVSAAVVGVATVGLIGGGVFAWGVVREDEAPAGTATSEGGTPAQAVEPNYPTNEAGQTYGPANQAVAVENEPDLILVVATSGKTGYVEKSQLDEVTGANVSSPEEAIDWQEQQDAATWDTITIPVYESDGKTVIGVFEVTRSTLDKQVGG